VFNRGYWIKREGEGVLTLVDDLLSTVNKLPEISGKAELEYGKGQIKIICLGKTLASCFPKNKYVRLVVKLSRSTDMDKLLSESELDVLDYNTRLGRYRIRMRVGEDNSSPAIMELIKAGLNDGDM
jgi:hypothetical protein